MLSFLVVPSGEGDQIHRFPVMHVQSQAGGPVQTHRCIGLIFKPGAADDGIMFLIHHIEQVAGHLRDSVRQMQHQSLQTRVVCPDVRQTFQSRSALQISYPS